MDDVRIGRQLRAIRHERGWRQQDVADRAGISQPAVSLVERGHLDAMPIQRLRLVARALEAELALTVRWRAGDLDRLLDEDHAGDVGQTGSWLGRRGWDLRNEVTYSVYGERGAIDILAWHAPTRTLLVVEVKTELTSVEATLRRHDAKVRLAAGIANERFGWRPVAVARLLTLPDTPTARRRVARHAAVLDAAYPLRGADVRAWVQSPTGAPACLAFLSTGGGRRSARRRRIRRARGSRC
jgi:transcriptional regulator with XRE-family HTH domain